MLHGSSWRKLASQESQRASVRGVVQLGGALGERWRSRSAASAGAGSRRQRRAALVGLLTRGNARLVRLRLLRDPLERLAPVP